MPLTVTGDPPSQVILPVIFTELVVISVTGLVIRTGIVGSFTQLFKNNVPHKKDRKTMIPGILVLPDLLVDFETLNLVIDFIIIII